MDKTLHVAVSSYKWIDLSIHMACHEQDLPFQHTILCHSPYTSLIPTHHKLQKSVIRIRGRLLLSDKGRAFPRNPCRKITLFSQIFRFCYRRQFLYLFCQFLSHNFFFALRHLNHVPHTLATYADGQISPRSYTMPRRCRHHCKL